MELDAIAAGEAGEATPRKIAVPRKRKGRSGDEEESTSKKARGGKKKGVTSEAVEGDEEGIESEDKVKDEDMGSDEV